ncbi:glycine zipper 2TM domain-containing protein [Catenovulum sp. 2E275]|uniref:glycine zipper 2TM domain-containing protein n=1 Tax=Catenovulum sp. 2E275 TaxID=2980497 RepID=UPI0021CEA201|nr:glycine zipper 2TM domain-containing protein [Catenovulum sp. 2E275]MCU4674923.1 glycine zipper 2TM domain-containing protein [Catenovulum sp. 2E275]
MKTQTKYYAIGLALSSLLITPAYAKHGHNQRDNITRAKVISVTPTYESVRIHQPQKECWIETSYSQPAYYSENRYRSHSQTRNQHNDAAAPIIGAVIGGVIGNQFGKGKGKPVATIAGAVIGGALANEAAANQPVKYHDRHNNRYNDRYNDHKHYKKQRKVCDINHNRVEYRQELTGYDVSYRYKGQIYYTHTRNHPGKFIDLAVNITPLE